MKKKVALIFGVTGQTGSYLARLLLEKKYIVHGVKRRSSSYNTSRIDDIYDNPLFKNKKLYLHFGDVTDTLSIREIIKRTKPNEIYNLAAQSHVHVSFELPEYTANADALGALRILEGIKSLKLEKRVKYYQAGTSELYGRVQTTPQNEKTQFYPRSPYGVAKLYAHWITLNYREAYNIFACNGILFNHESPLRGENFVTRKITIGLCKIKLKLEKKLYVGNLNARRDWGHAKDYAKAIWLIMQQKKPEDYVIATGHCYTVKKFIEIAGKELGMKIKWKGKGINEKGYDQNGKCIVECKKHYIRPLEVDLLIGDAKKARKKLKWKQEISFNSLVKEMVSSDLKFVKNHSKQKYKLIY